MDIKKKPQKYLFGTDRRPNKHQNKLTKWHRQIDKLNYKNNLNTSKPYCWMLLPILKIPQRSAYPFYNFQVQRGKIPSLKSLSDLINEVKCGEIREGVGGERNHSSCNQDFLQQIHVLIINTLHHSNYHYDILILYVCIN